MPDLNRLILPLHTKTCVLPNQTVRVVKDIEERAIDVTQLQLSGAGTAGGSSDWVVNDFEINGRSQLATKPLPGCFFGSRGVVTGDGASSTTIFEGLDVAERGQDVALTVTYVGPNPQGCPLYAAFIGEKPRQRPTIIPIGSKIPILPTQVVTVTARIEEHGFAMERLEIHDDGTPGRSSWFAVGRAADWLIADLRINGRTQFLSPGSIPGDLFLVKAINTFLSTLEVCEAGQTIEIDVVYIGTVEEGVAFRAHYEGTVQRANYEVAPPDLHVRVSTSDPDSEETIVATCNWRSPASDNRTK